MGRVVGRTRVREGVGTGMKLSETAVFIAIGVTILLAARWYFVIYRNSPGVALGEFIGAINAGNVSRQYSLIDDADKQEWPSEKEYESKVQLARGYTERISNTSIAPAVKDEKHPDIVTIEATLNLRGVGGKDLLDNGDAKTAVDTYTLRKDKDDHWKIWLTKSPPNKLLAVTPNPPGSSF